MEETSRASRVRFKSCKSTHRTLPRVSGKIQVFSLAWTNRDKALWTVNLSKLSAASRKDLNYMHFCLLDQSDGSLVGRQKLTRARAIKSLMPSTDLAKALHALLFHKDSYEATGADSIHFSRKEILQQEHDILIRSLLVLPPWSITPWNAATDIISSIFDGTLGGEQTQISTYLGDISVLLCSVGSADNSNMNFYFHNDQCERLKSLFHPMIEPFFIPVEVDPYCTSRKRARVEATSSFVDERNSTILSKKYLHFDLIMELLPTILSAGERLDQRISIVNDNFEEKDDYRREKNDIATSIYRDMMHAIFPMKLYETSKGNDAKRNIDTNGREIKPTMVLPLITASYNLGQHYHMRSCHWFALHTMITIALQGNNRFGQVIPSCDLPSLVKCIFISIEAASSSIAQSNISYINHRKYLLGNTEWYDGRNDDAIHVLSSWYKLLLNVYLASSKCDITIEKIGEVLKSAILKLSSRIVSLFLDFSLQQEKYFEKGTNIPLWVHANILLIIHQSQPNRLISIGKVTSDVLGKATSSGIDIRNESLNALMTLPLVDQSLIVPVTIYEKRNDELLCLQMEDVKTYFKNVYYAFDSNISNLDKEIDSLYENEIGKIFSAFVKLVHGSLFVGSGDKNSRNISGRCLRSHIVERSQMWVNVAFTLMNSIGEQPNNLYARSLLIATAILVTAFWEVTSSRIQIVRNLRHIISGSSRENKSARNRLELKINCCLVLSIIIRTTNFDDEADQEQLYDCLSPIGNLLKSSNIIARLPAVIILELMNALSSLRVGKEAILAMVRNDSQIHFESCLFWSKYSGDRMNILIEGLLCLIRDDPYILNTQSEVTILDDTGLEALCAITNLLVSNRSNQPFQARRLLLQKLLEVVEEGAINQWTQLRLMGAALVAYLPYFRSTSLFSSGKVSLQLNDIQFVPQNSLDVWDPLANNLNGYTSIREDLSSLTRLVLSLLHSDPKIRAPNMDPSSRVKINEEDIQPLLDIILPRKRVPVESKSSRRQKAFSRQILSGQILSGKILMPIAFSCIGAILTYLVRDEFHRNVDNQRNGNNFSMANGSCEELQKVICITEERQWSNHFKFQQRLKTGGEIKALVPGWVQGFSSTKLDSSFSKKYSVQHLRYISLNLSSLCSIMSGFLLSSAYKPVCKNKAKDMTQVRKLFQLSQSINILLGLKRKLVSMKGSNRNFIKRKSDSSVVVATNSKRTKLPKKTDCINALIIVDDDLDGENSDFLVQGHMDVNGPKTEELFFETDDESSAVDDVREKVAAGEGGSTTVTHETDISLRIQKKLPKSDTVEDTLDEILVLALEASEQEYYSVVQFFDCSREVLQNVLFGDEASHCTNILAGVSFIVPAIVDYCNYIDSTLHRTRSTERGLNQILNSLWNFYTTICSEHGFYSFIAFLEYHLLNSNIELKQFEKKSSQSSIKSITSHDDVTNYVCQLRSSVLSCLRGVLSIVGKSFTQEKHIVKSLKVISCFNIDFMFCVRAVYWFSQELYSGLWRDNNGMTTSIYELCVDIIEEGAKSTFEGCGIFCVVLKLDKGGLKLVHDLKKMCESASILLWNTVCNFDVAHPHLFKSSVQSSMWYLPQIVRRIDRLLLPPSAMKAQQLSSDQNKENGCLAAAMIHQCVEDLRIELKLMTKQKYSSNRTKLSMKFRWKEETSLVDSAYVVQPLVIPVPKRCGKVRFPNAKLRNWTFSCSITVAERMWMESRRFIIQARDTTDAKCVKDVSTNGLKERKMRWKSTTKHYASKRRVELTSTLNILNSLFFPFADEVILPNFNKLRRGASILAGLLPHLEKLRLCSCLEMISVTLNHSLKYISRWWQEAHTSDVLSLPEDKKYNGIVMAEAIACLLAWLSPIENGLSVVDFTICARTWYSIEKERDCIDDSKAGKDKILSRINKLLLCIEELDLIFQKTYIALKGEELQTNVKKNMSNLDKRVFDVLQDTCANEGKDSERLKTFGQIMCEHVERIDTMKLLVAKTFSNTESEEKESKNKDITLPRSRDNRRSKSKRQSRNVVVNEWLELDEEWNGDGEKNNDSYLDLEDFLVEG